MAPWPAPDASIENTPGSVATMLTRNGIDAMLLYVSTRFTGAPPMSVTRPYGAMQLTWLALVYSRGAEIPSMVTDVSGSVAGRVSGRGLVPGYIVKAAGPRPMPKMVIISPGDTPETA